MNDNKDQKRDNNTPMEVNVKENQALIAKIMQDPNTGQLQVFIQLEGDPEHAWIADGRHFQTAIFNPLGVKIEQAVKIDTPQIITPNKQVIKPN